VAVIANAGLDAQYVFGDLPVAEHQLDGEASGGSGVFVSWAWYLIDKPEGSGAGIDNATLEDPKIIGIDLPGTYMAFLVVEDDLGEFSETKRTLAPDSAYVHVRVSTENLALNKPAAGERNYHRQIQAAIDAIDDVDAAVGFHTIDSHDTSATGAELDTLTDGSNADALHTHAALNQPATTSLNGVVRLTNDPLYAPEPVVLNRRDYFFEASVDGTYSEIGGYTPGIIKPTTVSPQSQAMCAFYTTLGISVLNSFQVILGDGGDGGGQYEFELYSMTTAQYQANDWAGATLLKTISAAHSSNAPLVLPIGSVGGAVSAGRVLAVRCTEAPTNPGGQAYVKIHGWQSF